MFSIPINPNLLATIVSAILALAFDWFPKLAPWYDTLSELKKRQLMALLLTITIAAIFGGLCAQLITSPDFTCAQASLAKLIEMGFTLIVTNQGVHMLFKPTAAVKLARAKKLSSSKAQGMVEYALILVLVAVVVLAAVSIMGPLIGQVFSTINASL
jgi:pilus assembly protein Flp/PilA